jgi:hypothetical protein
VKGEREMLKFEVTIQESFDGTRKLGKAIKKTVVEAAGYAIEGGDLTFYGELKVEAAGYAGDTLSGRVASFRQWVSVVKVAEKK